MMIFHREDLGLTGIEKGFLEMNVISGIFTAPYQYCGEHDPHQLAKSSTGREVLWTL